MKQNWKNINMIATALVIIIIPILIYYFLAKQATLGEWLGFFGTYFGSAISIGFAYVNTKYQLIKEHEREVIDNLHGLLRSADILLNSLNDSYSAIIEYVEENSDFLIDSKISKKLQTIYNSMSQLDTFKVDIDFVMNQLSQSEREMISPKFKKWLDSYKSIDNLKFINKDGDLSYSYKEELISIKKFMKLSKELKLSIANVCDQRVKIYEK